MIALIGAVEQACKHIIEGKGYVLEIFDNGDILIKNKRPSFLRHQAIQTKVQLWAGMYFCHFILQAWVDQGFLSFCYGIHSVSFSFK